MISQADLLILGLCGQSVFLTVPDFHQPEETLHATSFFCEPGGKGYNQAVAAARMGAKTAFAGAVGCDADADACAARLALEGVQSLLIPKTGCHTAYAAILTDAKGENRITVYPGAVMSAEDVSALEPQLKAAKLVLLTPEIPEEAFAKAVQLAHIHHVRLIVNPAPFMPWVIPYLGDAWCVTPNRNEVCGMLGLSDAACLEAALADAPWPRMVVTLGAEGALCVQNGRITRIPAPMVTPVDTTGAGDALNGALCAALLAGCSLPEAAAAGVKAASLSVARLHVLDGMPRREDINECGDSLFTRVFTCTANHPIDNPAVTRYLLTKVDARLAWRKGSRHKKRERRGNDK
ncbi:MAG: ribokinase [Clostridia bacterium]|nr:ribokinase [Clostridia bacterium]